MLPTKIQNRNPWNNELHHKIWHRKISGMKNKLMKFCNTMKIIYELDDGKIYIIVYHPKNTSDTEKEA